MSNECMSQRDEGSRETAIIDRNHYMDVFISIFQ